MFLRITFKLWRKYKNEWVKGQTDYRIDCGQPQEDNQNREETQTPTRYVKDKTRPSMGGKIFPNLDIVTFKPHK
jgi:hypothetical protein